MLHILLLILKITGIIFAAILGILVLLVCVVIFVPVRYDAKASCDGTLAGLRAKAKVTWLFHLARLDVCYEKKELSFKIRIAWKSILNGQKDDKKIKKEVEAYDEKMEELWEGVEESVEEETQKDPENLETPGNLEKESREDPENRETLEENPKESREGPENRETLEENPKESRESPESREDLETSGNPKESPRNAPEVETDLEKNREGTGENRKEEKSQIPEKDFENTQDDGECNGERKEKVEETVYQKLTGIPGKIKDKIEDICDKIKALIEKKDKIFQFLSDEAHKKAFIKVKNEGFLLLRKLKPKTFLARLHYGFEDPCLTGKVLAGFSMVYPFLDENVKVYPDFGQRILEGQLGITGKIRISYFVKLLWDLIWCKEVRMTYRHVKNFKW